MQRACVTKSLIDVILTNRPELFSSCGTYNPEMSDHALIYGFIKEKVKPQKDRIIRSKRNFDKHHPKEDLCHAPLHCMLATLSTQLMIKLVSKKQLWLV